MDLVPTWNQSGGTIGLRLEDERIMAVGVPVFHKYLPTGLLLRTTNVANILPDDLRTKQCTHGQDKNLSATLSILILGSYEVVGPFRARLRVLDVYKLHH